MLFPPNKRSRTFFHFALFRCIIRNDKSVKQSSIRASPNRTRNPIRAAFRFEIAKDRRGRKDERERERERVRRVGRGKALAKLVGRRRVNGSVVMGVGGGVE